jgi:hypothetical protein
MEAEIAPGRKSFAYWRGGSEVPIILAARPIADF